MNSNVRVLIFGMNTEDDAAVDINRNNLATLDHPYFMSISASLRRFDCVGELHTSYPAAAGYCGNGERILRRLGNIHADREVFSLDRIRGRYLKSAVRHLLSDRFTSVSSIT